MDEQAPLWPRNFRWDEVLLFGDGKITLVGDQRDVAEEEAKGTCAEVLVSAWWRGGRSFWACDISITRARVTGEILDPELGVQEIPRERLEEDAALSPDEMHLYHLVDDKFTAQGSLNVQRSWRDRSPGKPEATDHVV